MASFGHVAAGLLAARLHGGGNRKGDGPSARDPDGQSPPPRPVSWWSLLLFSGLALLPDADVLLVALGACDTGVCGHRGASHSFFVAAAIGFIAGLLARRLGWPALRTGVVTAFAVSSHAVLDLLGAGGRGLPLFWPFSDARFESPVRIFPDAPRGLALLSMPGVVNVAIEFLVFLPMMVYALWPRIAAWLSRRAGAPSIAKLPQLTFVGTLGGIERIDDAGGGLSPAPAPAATEERDPPIRSAG